MPWLNTRTLRKHRLLYPQWMVLNFLHKLSLLTGPSAVDPLPMERWKERIQGLHIYFFFFFEKLLSDDLLFVERKALQSCKQWGNSLWQWLICIWEILRNEEIKEMGKFISYSFGWLHWESGCWRALNGDKIRKCCLFFLPGF